MSTTPCPFAIGDTLTPATPHAFARKIRITEVTDTHFMADVLIGENIKEPLKVFRAGWFLYKKIEEPKKDEDCSRCGGSHSTWACPLNSN